MYQLIVKGPREEALEAADKHLPRPWYCASSASHELNETWIVADRIEGFSEPVDMEVSLNRWMSELNKQDPPWPNGSLIYWFPTGGVRG